jgi:hypothetical protein
MVLLSVHLRGGLVGLFSPRSLPLSPVTPSTIEAATISKPLLRQFRRPPSIGSMFRRYWVWQKIGTSHHDASSLLSNICIPILKMRIGSDLHINFNHTTRRICLWLSVYLRFAGASAQTIWHLQRRMCPEERMTGLVGFQVHRRLRVHIVRTM